jgi:hypothetical protein
MRLHLQRLSTSFLFFHLNFSCSTYADNGNAASQLSYTLLKLLAIVVAGFYSYGFFDLCTNCFNASFNALAFASTVDND